MKKKGEVATVDEWQEFYAPAGIFVILGRRGRGKSCLAWFLAEEFHKLGRPVVSFATPRQAKKLLPDWVKHMDKLEKLAKQKAGSVVVVDEASFKVAARRHATADNLIWGQMTAISRHKQLLVIFIAQHTRQIDINLIGDSDLTLFKEPSELHIRFARPELRPDVEQARRVIRACRSGKPHEWTWIKDYGEDREGLLQNPPPSFWSEDLSRSFALVDLEAFPTSSGKAKSNGKGQLKPGKRPKIKIPNMSKVRIS